MKSSGRVTNSACPQLIQKRAKAPDASSSSSASSTTSQYIPPAVAQFAPSALSVGCSCLSLPTSTTTSTSVLTTGSTTTVLVTVRLDRYSGILPRTYVEIGRWCHHEHGEAGNRGLDNCACHQRTSECFPNDCVQDIYHLRNFHRGSFSLYRAVQVLSAIIQRLLRVSSPHRRRHVPHVQDHERRGRLHL